METNLAVLIDFENIAAGTEKEGLGRFDVESLIQRVKDKGRILVARSYGDWGRFSRFKQALLTSNVTMMELTSHGMQDKNRADIAMVVDALELAFTRAYVDTFVVVSGDSDFTPLVLKMRELNKRVIGIGTRKSTSRLLIQACDEFIFYDTIVQPKQKRTATRKVAGRQNSEVAQAFELLEEALDGLQRENPDPPHGSLVKSAILRKTPDFSESDLGFNSFARFLEAAQEAGLVRIIRDTKSGGYRVDALEDEEEPTRAPVAEVEPGANWVDEYMPSGVDLFTDVLAKAGHVVVSAATRLAVLEALEQVVEERDQKRRKTTLQFVREDMRKKLRRTHPDLPNEVLRSILDGLLSSGELIHRDGTAIRSATAPFTLQKNAEGLNETLIRVYLAHLREAGVDLSDTGRLAELLYGDADRRRAIEETLAWLVTEGDREDLDLDLDDLLSVDARPEPEPETDGPSFDIDAVLEPVIEDAPAEEEPRKRRRTRKKSDAADEAPSVEAKVEPEPAPAPAAEDKPKVKRSTTRSRKKVEPAEAPAEPADDLDLDLDALLEPAPKKKSTKK
ncbi:MAG: NYN domain-containing protein [Alphaproteobacteria bacterium]|nr:NYN domain-containing protein [Alphaproteobacteria bacterium]MCB9696517.1 NYN domain-containing protein [Alphaproteobacteria bacterium]